MSRTNFRQTCVERDGGECLVPSCRKEVTADPDGPGEVHHIIERKLWEDGGYIPENGASVCNEHHRLAEDNIIPPQAFWRWIDTEKEQYITIPGSITDEYDGEDTVSVWPSDDESGLLNVDKWGEPLDSPPWKEHRERIKYPSTRHLPFSHERDADDTAHDSLDWLTEYPVVITVKMDGGNAMLVKDTENPVRARNGRQANKEHFDMAKQWYWNNNLFGKLPEHIQVFGEWLYAKHSIHYGCDCDEPCEDVGPPLRDYFQVFGMYDTRYDVWLGWHETVEMADEMGLTMAPSANTCSSMGDAIETKEFRNTQEAWDYLWTISQEVVDAGHEGIVVRSVHPFHYGQISERLGKYVRPGHVKEDEEHWSKRSLVQNVLE